MLLSMPTTTVRIGLLVALLPFAGCRDATPGTRSFSLGAACSSGADCASGECNFGPGCGPLTGTCVEAMRPCTMDVATLCGCDGRTFESGSGSCIDRPYASRGACPAPVTETPVVVDPPPPGKTGVGGTCLTGADCESGRCEHKTPGCNAAGTCVDRNRPCVPTVVQLCGCDGKLFTTSPGCVERPWDPAMCAAAPPASRDLAPPKSPLAPPRTLAVGATCSAGTECESGRCEGRGPGCGAQGVCVHADTPCTADVAHFCGCDGKTFESSSSCVGVAYARRGSCGDEY